MKILIDGYNLIFECGLHGRKVNANSLAKARTELLQQITKYLSPEQCRNVTVVFDAKRQPLSDQQATENFAGIEVLFSRDYDDADALIEQLIKEHSHPKQLTVVSSDHRIHKAALRRKAKPIDSGIWFDQLPGIGAESVGLSDLTESESGADLLKKEDVEMFKKDVLRDLED